MQKLALGPVVLDKRQTRITGSIIIFVMPCIIPALVSVCRTTGFCGQPRLI